MFVQSSFVRRYRVYVLALTFCGLMMFSTSAEADIAVPHQGGRPVTLDAPIAGFGYYGFGGAFGLRVGIPIVENGFVPTINNAVYINFGADLYPFGQYIAIGIPITVHWEFYFNDKWSAFAELGINIFLGDWVFGGQAFRFDAVNWLMFAVGGKFHITPSFALVLRAGNPYASFGISFSF
ncbi:MAG TPA: hypothetical protein DCE42_04315 [Myxococcales bacterium]|nr:hypothetical protein [Deltaproteobacteria bacterium]HAA53951.1 hypothetical protein [Myxococcales bacterium]